MYLLVSYAMSFVGKPYKWGGDDPMSGYDCSGFMQELLSSCGIDPPGDQTAQALYDHFEKINGNITNTVTTGALLFFGKSVTKITHVAMALDSYRMIEAGGGGSKTITLQNAIDQNAYIRVRHIKNRSDLVAIVKPNYSRIGII